MLQYLGRLLSLHAQGVIAAYLSKAQPDAVWKEGRLIAIYPQGLVFETRDETGCMAECLLWASLAAVRIRLGNAQR